MRGPFSRENPPVLPKGAPTVLKEYPNRKTIHFGRILRDTDGTPMERVAIDARVDVPNGPHENHDPDRPHDNLRGRVVTDENGHCVFRALRPVGCPIPDNETTGEPLPCTGLHPMRPGPGAEGRMRIGFVRSSTFGILPGIAHFFRGYRPDGRLTLTPMNNAQFCRSHQVREIDAAFARPALTVAEFRTVRPGDEPL